MDEISEVMKDPTFHPDNREWILRFDQDQFRSGRSPEDRAASISVLKLLSENLPVLKGSLEDLRDYVAKGTGNTAFQFHYGRIIDAMGVVLFSLNERYDPATKHAEQAYAKLTSLPPNFLDRYNGTLELPLTRNGRREIVRSLDSLARDIERLASY